MIFVVLTLILISGIFYFGNRWNYPEFGSVPVENENGQIAATDEITVTTWNIGFAALGAKADLFIDGGKSLRALAKPDIKIAADSIANTLAKVKSDVIIIQETASASFLTRSVPVQSIIEERLQRYSTCFWSDFRTRFAPLPLKFLHGMSNFALPKSDDCFALELPQDPLYYYGFLKKYYAAITQKFPIKGRKNSWVVINIHLSAFDKGANVRKRQLVKLFDYARQEYDAGNYVIIGGDWNMRVSLTNFPHETPKEAQFWVFDFPFEKLPENWKFAVDDTVPTVRTIHQPYVRGENFTSIIDGFVVSPNISFNEVRTHDLGFEHTDHNPVSVKFTAALD